MNIHMINTIMYIYIYISLSISLSLCVYIYIHVYIEREAAADPACSAGLFGAGGQCTLEEPILLCITIMVIIISSYNVIIIVIATIYHYYYYYYYHYYGPLRRQRPVHPGGAPYSRFSKFVDFLTCVCLNVESPQYVASSLAFHCLISTLKCKSARFCTPSCCLISTLK